MSRRQSEVYRLLREVHPDDAIRGIVEYAKDCNIDRMTEDDCHRLQMAAEVMCQRWVDRRDGVVKPEPAHDF